MLTATAFYSRPIELITRELEDQFFSNIKTGNSTFKQTNSGRFALLDSAVTRRLSQAGVRLASVLDVGMSSGITTLELHDGLRDAGHAQHTTGTDLALDASIISFLPGCRALVDEFGHPLQYEFLGMAMRPWRRRLDYFNGMIVVRWLANRLSKGRIARMRSRADRKVALVSPRLSGSEGITLVKDDILTSNPAFARRFDFIRVCNILNRDYFGDADLRRGLANVLSYLSGPDAWLLIARTHGRDDHHGTLFRLDKDGQRLVVVERFGPGSEVEKLALDCASPIPSR